MKKKRNKRKARPLKNETRKLVKVSGKESMFDIWKDAVKEYIKASPIGVAQMQPGYVLMISVGKVWNMQKSISTDQYLDLIQDPAEREEVSRQFKIYDQGQQVFASWSEEGQSFLFSYPITEFHEQPQG